MPHMVHMLFAGVMVVIFGGMTLLMVCTWLQTVAALFPLVHGFKLKQPLPLVHSSELKEQGITAVLVKLHRADLLLCYCCRRITVNWWI